MTNFFFCKTLFNISEFEGDGDLMGSITFEFQKRYRDRKAEAKQAFLKAGGYDDVQRALDHAPEGMEEDNWKKAIEFFHTDKHLKRSASNKGCRAKQQFPNRGGTVKYSSACYKEVMFKYLYII